MKAVKTFLLSVTAVIAVASMAFAAGEKKTEQVPSSLPVATEVQQITGEVKAVNTIAKSITINKKVGNRAIEATVTVDDKTKIMEGNEKKTFADIKAGGRAVVKYTKANGRNIAEGIALKPAGPESKKSETKKRGSKNKKS